MSAKHALIIATSHYEDTVLRQLVAPALDAEDLAKVLRDPAIAGFEVQIVLNQPSYRINEELETFFADRQRDDLLLLYFSGHGIKDEDGRLYFATPNTRNRMLRATAVRASDVNEIMLNSRSKRQVLVLDCCHSGAFAKGMVAKGGSDVGTRETFQGHGRVVLTASDAMQYSFEGEKVEGEGVRSVFTRALVHGIQSGEADRDGDGLISLDELYDYAHKRVTAETPRQRPMKWALGVEGEIVIARNLGPVKPVELPLDLQHLIDNAFTPARLEAVRKLEGLLRGKHRGLAAAAREALSKLQDDDSRAVSSAAEKGIAAYAETQKLKEDDAARDKAERDRAEGEKAEQERMAREKAEGERLAAAKAEAERVAKEKEEQERRAREEAEQKRLALEKAEREKGEQERIAREKLKKRWRPRFLAVVALAIVLSFGGFGLFRYLRSMKLYALKQTITGHSDSVTSIAFSPDGRLLASGSDDETIKLWDVATGGLKQTLTSHNDSFYSVAFSPDGRLLASGTDDKTIKLWDVATGGLKQTLTGHNDSVYSVAFSPDGRLLASGSEDKTIKLWDVATGELKQTLAGEIGRVLAVTFSPDGRLLASGGFDMAIRLWDVATIELKQTLSGHQYWVRTVDFSPDGRQLASGSHDRTIKLWDVATGGLKQTLTGHNDSVYSVAFSPDGRLLASGSKDKTIKLWDMATGASMETLSGHSGGVIVAFSPDGRLLASGSEDETIKLWAGNFGLSLWLYQSRQATPQTWVPDSPVQPSGTAILTGSVADRSGAIIPNAEITVYNVASDTDVRTVTTDSEGFYALQIPAGTYRVAVTASGFQNYTANDVILRGGEVRALDVVLQLP